MKTIAVKVKPNSPVSNLVALEDGTWLAQVKAPPADGKANEELIRLVAEHFHLRKTQVTIKRGASGRMKQIQLEE